MALEVVYLPHPVTEEDKKEWLKQGFRIIDAKFAPEGYTLPKDVAIKTTRKVAPSGNIDFDKPKRTVKKKVVSKAESTPSVFTD